MTLRLDSIQARYGSIHAINSVTAEARPGCVTVVVGPNAAGKSTLLRCAAGIQHCGGSVAFNGESLLELSGEQRARRVAWMAQRPRADVPLLVQDVIELGRPRSQRDPDRIEALMASLELGGLESRMMAGLSVGQQQRVAMARSLYQLRGADGLLIFDEPTAPMDPRHAMMALDHLIDAAGSGATVLLSLHDIGLAASIADEAWLLREGCLLASGPVDSVLEPDRLEAAFGIGYEKLPRSDGSQWLVPLRGPKRV